MSPASHDDDSSELMSEINMVPLIDIMLVLLIIFIITVPVIKNAINLELPEAVAEPEKIDPTTINLSIAADGGYYLETTLISDENLREKFSLEAKKNPTPSVHISGDKNVRYERVVNVMSMAQEVGLDKIGFVTDPNLTVSTNENSVENTNESSVPPKN